jgi:lysozyme
LTIGWGHTGADVTEGLVITQERADEIFTADLASFVAGVNSAVRVSLMQNEFDALVSFAYNDGVTALRNSTLLALLNAGHHIDAAAEFPKWSHVDKLVSKGLLIRRCRETLLFLS